MTWLFVEPSDVWLFRDGRPFDAGADHRARSLFPPNPTTMQGALRAKLLYETGVSLEAFAQAAPSAQAAIDLIGRAGEPPPFALRGPFVARVESEASLPDLIFPLPADVAREKEAPGQDTYHLLRPLSGDGPFAANWPADGLRPLWRRSDALSEAVTRWVSANTLAQCLGDTAPDADDVWRADTFFAREPRFGVGMDDDRKRSAEGLLYQAEFVRPREGVGLLVKIDDRLGWPDDTGLLALGGERRVARYRRLDEPPLEPSHVPPPPEETGQTRFKLYFATPAYFAEGWQTTRWDRWFQVQNLQLIAAALPRFYPAGGVRVDMESQRGYFKKTSRRYVPVGSVFFFACDGAAQYNGQPITDDDNDAQIGFGQVYFGRWNYV